MKHVIVTADDFGLTKSINEGITKACKEGIVTEISVLPTGEAFDDALNVMRSLGLKEIGAHLALTETGPVLKQSEIPSLVSKGGGFYKNHNEFFVNFFLKKIDRDEIYRELKGQIERLGKCNIPIMSLSSHEHIHMLPGLLEIFIRLAKEHNIPAIRHPHKDTVLGKFDVKKRYKSLILSYFEKGTDRALTENDVAHTDHFMGFLDSGALKEDTLIDMLKSLKDGTTELVCHPGFLGPEILDRYRFHINCEEELFAITSPRVKNLIKNEGIKLISYHEFLAQKF